MVRLDQPITRLRVQRPGELDPGALNVPRIPAGRRIGFMGDCARQTASRPLDTRLDDSPPKPRSRKGPRGEGGRIQPLVGMGHFRRGGFTCPFVGVWLDAVTLAFVHAEDTALLRSNRSADV